MKTPIIPEREYGFIAQEVREILPDLVIEDEEGYLAINYTGVIPLLVEAYKNLQTQVEYLENRISDCCQESNLKSASLLSGNEENLSTENTLYQNTPNPFSLSTTIRYSLSKNVLSGEKSRFFISKILCFLNVNELELSGKTEQGSRHL